MDGFEYPVSTSDLDAVDRFKVLGGWSHAKTHQSSSGAHGYLYTVDSIPGYSGPFPGRESSRVLAIAALPATLGGQTDFYLQLGNGSSAAYDDTIPGDVWIQFWIYPQNYGSEASVYANRNKFFYVCNSDFPCHSHLWMIGNNPGTYLADNMQPLGSPTNQGYFWSLSQAGGMSQIVNTTGDPYTQGTIGPQDASDFVVPNRWTLVKMHFNTTRTSGNSWEVWMRPYGGEWRKVSEWIGGRTPGFTWDIPAEHVGGHRVLRMPTTVGGFDGRSSYNYWQYMDDFVISGSEAGLPQYSD